VGGDAATEAAQNRMFGLSGRGIFRVHNLAVAEATSPMANMMGRWFVPNARNSVSLAQAKAKAQFCPAQKRTL